MKKNLLLLIVSIFASFNGFSQNNFHGIITDSLSGKPVEGVAITIENSYQVSISNEKGEFEIDNIPAGNFKIRTHLIGYTDFTSTVSFPFTGSYEIKLIPSPIQQNEIIVTATRAGNDAPLAVSTITKDDLIKSNTGRDVPYLLQSIPSIVVTSDAGTGIGYTGIRIRGSDPTRINVTVDGIPINDAESQGMYWVDLPDIASSIENIQVQRGVGTSTNGAGSFGGSINIQTNKPQANSYASATSAIGSFNTLKNNISFGTGLIKDHWNFEGRLSKITSDGYVDRGSSDLKSFFVSGGYYGKNDFLKINIFSGKEITYQSWNGVPEAALDTNRTWNYYTYENQVDNYQQDNYHMIYNHEFNSKLNGTIGLHYTKGKGYYEEYEKDQLLTDYNLSPVIIKDTTIYNSDLIRRKWLDNDFYGSTFSINFKPNFTWNFIFGGAWNQYDGDHYNEVIWARFFSSGEINNRYYKDNGLKTDFNTFIKTTFTTKNNITLFVDLQYRNVAYKFRGFNKDLLFIPQKVNLSFINPKIGATLKLAPDQSCYASLSIGNKEPSRDDYTESSIESRPKPETLYDLESGYKFNGHSFSAGINYFRMMYTNQLVLTGKINDVGNYTRTNVNDSYREGIEIEFGWKPLNRLTLSGNTTLSRNKIKDYFEYIDNYDLGTQEINEYTNTDIAFSPNVTSRLEAEYVPVKNLSVSLAGNYVGKQYLDNTSNDRRKLDPFLVSDFRLNFLVHPKFMKEISITAEVHNLFNEMYESNGYTFSYIYGGEKTTENFYYPQAGRNYMLQLKLNF